MLDNLTKLIDRLPEGVRLELIGDKIGSGLKAYKLFHSEASNKVSTVYSDDVLTLILIEKYGEDILATKENKVLEFVIRFLELEEKLDLAKLLNIKSMVESVIVTKVVNKFSFKNIEESKVILDYFDLPYDMLPKEPASPVEKEKNTLEIPDFSLHSFQKIVKDKVVRLFFRDDATRLLVHLPTGSGKTKTAAEIISDYIRNFAIIGGLQNTCNVIWIAHNNELCEQAYDTIRKTWILRGDTEVIFHRIFGNYELPNKEELSTTKTNIFIVGFPKMIAIKRKVKTDPLSKVFMSFLIKYGDFSVIDEAHKSIAKQWFDAIEPIVLGHGKNLMGLTATPGRNIEVQDVQNKILSELYGGNIIKLMHSNFGEITNPIQYLQEKQYLAEIKEIPVLTEVEIKLSDKEYNKIKQFGEGSIKSILNDLSINPKRNFLIIEALMTEYYNNNQVLVFACSVDHCYILQSILKAEGISSTVIDANTKKNIRAEAIRAFKNDEIKILFNYEVLSTGFDHAKLKSLMIARPTSSIVLYSQMIGRVIRGPRNIGKDSKQYKEKRLITIKDNLNIGGQKEIFGHFDEIWKQ